MPSPLRYGETCYIMRKRSYPDGMGGKKTRWITGKSFNALFALEKGEESHKGEQDTVKDYFNVTISKKLRLAAGDYIKRKNDKQIFRITSPPDEQVTPDKSKMDFKVCTAVKSVIPE